MSFAPGEAYQFDWSHETITLQGLPLTVKAAHMKLSHGRMPFVRVYFRETQELVFDAHDKAFRFYGGVCRRGIYDNMKTAVETPLGPVDRRSADRDAGRDRLVAGAGIRRQQDLRPLELACSMLAPAHKRGQMRAFALVQRDSVTYIHRRPPAVEGTTDESDPRRLSPRFRTPLHT